jgi:NAD(P)-dependent dehydrogenase (short-subunit alcohol dehydrogenase family)
MTRTIIVTGASSGIGRAAAERFLDAGWNVALIARRADALAEVAGARANGLPITCDVSDEGSVDAAFARATGHFGRIDALFNNAGLSKPAGLIDEIPLSDWTDTLSVNLTGMFLCARAAFRHMRAQSPQGGRIINNGSISATPRQACRDGSDQDAGAGRTGL